MNLIPLDKLLEEWEKDSVIDRINPGEELIRVPVLHSKYISQLTSHSVALKMKKLKFDELKKVKYEYYSGKLNDPTFLKSAGWSPFPYLLMKNDIPVYMEADADLIALKKGMVNNEEAINLCTHICKELNSRTYQLKEYLTWERFKRGQT